MRTYHVAAIALVTLAAGCSAIPFETALRIGTPRAKVDRAVASRGGTLECPPTVVYASTDERRCFASVRGSVYMLTFSITDDVLTRVDEATLTDGGAGVDFKRVK